MRLIDANALYREMVVNLAGNDLSRDPNGIIEDMLIDILRTIRAAPIIERPENTPGRETIHATWKKGGCGPYCSLCDELSMMETKFCPNCGARMDGGEGDGQD